MIDAAEEALTFIEGNSKEESIKDRMLILSLIKEIEIIGEAASKITQPFKKKHSEIPWEIIVGTRNRLIHGYFDVNFDVIWNTVTIELPALIKQLKKILKKIGSCPDIGQN